MTTAITVGIWTFSISKMIAPDLFFWHPQGWKIFREIENYMRAIHKAHGYQETRTPTIVSRHLWEVSGHWDKFQENMFITGDSIDSQNENMVVEARYALRPMSCPSHVQIYKSKNRSYREVARSNNGNLVASLEMNLQELCQELCGCASSLKMMPIFFADAVKS